MKYAKSYLLFKLVLFVIYDYLLTDYLLVLFSQGTYVLQDNKFSLLTQLSNGKQYLDQAPKVSKRCPSYMHILMPSWNLPEIFKELCWLVKQFVDSELVN